MNTRQTAAVENALRRIKKEKVTAYRAALQEGLAISTVYRAIARQRQKEKIRLQSIQVRYHEKRTTACTYCGAPAKDRDHVPAQSQLIARGTNYFRRKRIPLVIVTACKTCNSILGDKPLHTVEERRHYINAGRTECRDHRHPK